MINCFIMRIDDNCVEGMTQTLITPKKFTFSDTFGLVNLANDIFRVHETKIKIKIIKVYCYQPERKQN